jgi:hypothetical protein
MTEPSKDLAGLADVQSFEAGSANVLRAMMDGLKFAELPTEEHWLVEGLIRPRSVNLFQGDPGSMKTWLALELVRAVATGSPFLGTFDTRCGACLAIMMDSGEPDLVKQWRRLTARDNEGWRRDLAAGNVVALGINDFADRVRFWLPPQIDLTNQTFVSRAIEELKAIQHSHTLGDPGPMFEYFDDDGEFDEERYLADLGERHTTGVNLVVIDSLSKTHAGNENDNVHMAQVLAGARRIAGETGAAVVIIHHLAKPGEFNGAPSIYRARGATSIVANSDCVLMLEAQGGDVSLVRHIRMRGVRLPDFPIKLVASEESASLLVAETATDEQREFLEYVGGLDGGRITRQQAILWIAPRVRAAKTREKTQKRAQNAADSLLKALVGCDLLRKESAGQYCRKDPDAPRGDADEPESGEA